MNITGYADDNVIILTDRNVSGQIIPYTLETATKSIAEVARKQGKVLMFFSLEGGSHWEMWQFFGLDVTDWEDVSQWKSIYNVWNKFVGWYDTVEELYQLHVYPIDGKYALVGPTLKDVVIYQGTPGGWMPLDVNLYQKLLNDFLELVNDGVIVLTDCQKEILKEWLKEMGIGCDCDGSGGKDPWSSAWGPIGRPYTTFLVTTDFTSDETFKFTYPTSIFHDNSDEESVGQPALHSITLNGTGANPISLNFTAGTWSDIFTHRFEPNAYIPYKDLQYKDDAGYMYININEMIPGLQYTIKRTYKGEVTDPGSVVRPFVNNLATRCDGADYEIHLMKPNNCKVTINYYDSVTSRIKTKTIEVPYGEPFPAPVITDATYIGHNFTGWATNNQDSVSDPDNPYNVVGRSTKVPAYYNFSQPITSDKVLNAWYNIDAVFDWNDNNGHHTVPRTANYNTNITDVPSVDAYTGYIFQGWRLGDTTIAPGNPVGPILKPVTINGVWQQEIPEYNYFVKNNTDYKIQVTVGGQAQTIPAGETKTFVLENTPQAVVTVTTTPPSDSTKTVVWTINGSPSSTKTVDAGNVTIGANITYIYKVYNNSTISSIQVTVGDQTKTVTTNSVYSLSTNLNTVTITTPAPAGHIWVINSEEGSSKSNVAPGNVFISLATATNSNAVDIVFYNTNTQSLEVCPAGTYQPENYPSATFEPIGFVLIPSSHNQALYGDDFMTVLSFKAMDRNYPENGFSLIPSGTHVSGYEIPSTVYLPRGYENNGESELQTSHKVEDARIRDDNRNNTATTLVRTTTNVAVPVQITVGGNVVRYETPSFGWWTPTAYQNGATGEFNTSVLNKINGQSSIDPEEVSPFNYMGPDNTRWYLQWIGRHDTAQGYSASDSYSSYDGWKNSTPMDPIGQQNSCWNESAEACARFVTNGTSKLIDCSQQVLDSTIGYWYLPTVGELSYIIYRLADVVQTLYLVFDIYGVGVTPSLVVSKNNYYGGVLGLISSSFASVSQGQVGDFSIPLIEQMSHGIVTSDWRDDEDLLVSRLQVYLDKDENSQAGPSFNNTTDGHFTRAAIRLKNIPVIDRR